MMKKTLHLLLALFAFTYVSAQDFIDGDYGYTIDGNTVKVHSYTGAGGAITIPEAVFNGGVPYQVTTIGLNAFLDNVDITSVVLPASVTVLENTCFSGCTNLTSINCDNIVELGISSLANLFALTDYGTFNSLTTMSKNSFVELSGLTSFELPETLTRYEIGLGNKFYKVETFNIPSTVVHIDNSFFRFVELKALQVNWSADQLNGTNGETAINVNVKNFLGNLPLGGRILYVPVGTKAAYEAHSLLGGFNVVEGTLADLPAPSADPIGTLFTIADIEYKITSVDDLEAEVASSTLANITVPATVTKLDGDALTYSVTAIGGDAFKDNATVTSVVLPASVTVLGANAFSGSVNLETINLENIVTIETQNVFFNCPKLTTANLAAATDIGNFAFHGLGDSTLSSISIPSAVNIGKSAFRTSQITSLDIPASVVTIGDVVFMDCTALTALQVNWTTSETIPAILATVFTNLTPANITLYVPTGTAAFYTALDGWKDLNIIEGTLSVKGVKEIEFGVYPNPTSNLVSITSLEKIINITVLNANGSVLLNTNSTQLDLSTLASGVYFVKVVTANGASVKSVVKK